mgnify:CR=1 FL=1
MQIAAKGLHVDLSQSYIERFTQGIEAMLEKYFGRADKADVTLSKRQGDFISEVHVHIGKELDFKASAFARNAYKSLDLALKALAKQLRRNKRRLREDHDFKPMVDQGLESSAIAAAQASVDLETPANLPLVIADQPCDIPELTVSQASMVLENSGQPWMVFVDKTTAKPAVLYKREDGNHGWFEPGS